MQQISLLPGEAFEELCGDKKIIQNKNLYRFTSDSILLSRFARAKYGDVVADFCSGSGIVGLHFLCLNGHISGVTLFEMQPSLSDMAARTIAFNGFENALAVCCRLQDIGREYDDPYWDTLLDQFSAEELMGIVAYGGFQTDSITSINKPSSSDKDGPAGLDASQLGGDTCYTFPSDSMLGCTWNKELVAQLGYYISQDCLLTGTTGWYAPACNIHRVSICGRTREYFSEDAYLSGAMSYAIATAAQAGGVVTYTKHFALNEQENNRSTVCTFANEQSIREIYLKPFEMAVAEGGSMGIMTSMNRVGAVYSSSHYNLCTAVLKDEWGFKGVVITDFVSGPSDKVVPREMILADTDLFLCTASDQSMFVENYAGDADILNALRDSAHRICYAYANSNLMNGLTASSVVVDITPAWVYWMVALDALVLYGAYIAVISPVLSKKQPKEVKANEAA